VRARAAVARVAARALEEVVMVAVEGVWEGRMEVVVGASEVVVLVAVVTVGDKRVAAVMAVVVMAMEVGARVGEAAVAAAELAAGSGWAAEVPSVA